MKKDCSECGNQYEVCEKCGLRIKTVYRPTMYASPQLWPPISKTCGCGEFDVDGRFQLVNGDWEQNGALAKAHA